ncbi:MAG: relaxase/mobilization nuclease domain-containing protein [Planctomycetota bacterium]
MINVVTAHGSSFKGLSAYLLSDLDRQGDERVAWTETHGLATDDPEQAWRIMVATAKSQAELKAEAGVKNTGRKSHKHVMHYVLSWSPDEHGQIDRAEMVAAAKASMTYLGTYEGEKLGKGKTAKRTQHADEHQAVIVCHDEGPRKNPHVHIMLNRVHPEHGVMLPDSKDYEKLSAWALDYRTAQGKEGLCPERAKNAAKKAQGIVTNNPRKPRNVYETEQAIEAADPGSRKKAQLEAQQRKAKELKAKTEAMKQDHAAAMRELETRQVEAEKVEKAKTGHAIKAAVNQVRAGFAPKIDQLAEKQAAERAAFEEAKETAGGRVRNAWKAVSTKKWLNDLRTQKFHAVTGAFKLAFSSGLQEQQLESVHRREKGQLNGQKTAAEREATQALRSQEAGRLDELRGGYGQERGDLLLTQGMERAKLKAEWHEHKKAQLSIEIEDERAKARRAEIERDGEGNGSSGSKSPTPERDTPAAEAVSPPRNAAPADTPDPRIDRLKRLSQQAKQRLQSASPPRAAEPNDATESQIDRLKRLSREAQQRQQLDPTKPNDREIDHD